MDFVAWNLLGLSRVGQNNNIKALFYPTVPKIRKNAALKSALFWSFTQRRTPKGRRSHLHRGRGLKSRRPLFQGSQASPVCPSDNNSIEMKKNMEQWRNGTEKGKPKYWDKNRFQCRSTQQKSQMNWQVFEPGLPL